MAILGLVLGLLPASRLKNRLMSFVPGWRVAPDAVVKPCLIYGVRTLEVGPKANIGFGNAFRTLRRVTLRADSEIGQLNWFSAAARYESSALDSPLAGSLELAERSGITSRHYVDCSGGLSVGELAVIGGVRSTIVSHGIDSTSLVIQAMPIRVGPGSILNSGCIVAAGVTIGTRCIVGAGAVVTRDLTDSETLYGGVPARSLRSLAGSPMFERDTTRFMPRGSGVTAGDAPRVPDER